MHFPDFQANSIVYGGTSALLYTILLKPDFHSRFSLVASEILRMGHAQSGETNRKGRKKYLSLCSHLKFKYFNFCEIFLQRNESDFFLESRGHFTTSSIGVEGTRTFLLFMAPLAL